MEKEMEKEREAMREKMREIEEQNKSLLARM
jgi:hypothetical protein